MKKKITMMDVKQALLDARFREQLPDKLSADVTKFLQNPGCGCNHPLYKRIMQEAHEQLINYFPLKEEVDESVEEKESSNNWQVVNCTIHDLQRRLRELGPGRKQIEVARYKDQVTVVVNEIE